MNKRKFEIAFKIVEDGEFIWQELMEDDGRIQEIVL
jgi:hypothetical protein